MKGKHSGWAILLTLMFTGPAAAEDLWNGFLGAGRKTPLRTAPTLPALLTGAEPKEKEPSEEEEPIATDRPDFVEATRNVGLGRLQFEGGYTFFHDREGGVTKRRHGAPELLTRYGVFEWLELRIYQNFVDEVTAGQGQRQTARGAEDLYLGFGVNLSEEDGLIPESRILLFMTVPSGSDELTRREVMPGFNLLYGWDLMEGVSFSGSTQAFREQDDAGGYYTTWAQAGTFNIALGKKLSLYLESFGLFPSGAQTAGPEYYADGGFTYKITPNFQLDIRAGVGLNRHADDFFAGTGFGIRF